MTDIAIREAPAPIITPERIELIKRTFFQGATDDELELAIQACKRLRLDPFARQIFFVKRWDSRERRYVMAIQVSIDGFRLIAERTGAYRGQTQPQWCGSDGVWREVWLSPEPPAAARVGVYRAEWSEPVWGVARWASYVQTKKDGSPSPMWEKMGDVMIAKCAESQALRKAFPNDLSGVYTVEEMAQAENESAPAPQPSGPTEADTEAWALFQAAVDAAQTQGELAEVAGKGGKLHPAFVAKARDIYKLKTSQLAAHDAEIME